MRTLTTLAAAIAALAVFAGPAAAAGQVCYAASVTVNGDALVDEAACHQLP